MRTFLTFVAVFLQVSILTASGWSRAYTEIVSPAHGQCVTGPDVRVQFRAGGVQLAPGGYNLHFKLDDEPFHVQYKGNFAHVFKDVKPGTHTARMYIANERHEAIPGTLSVVSFNVAYGDGANLPAPGRPMLTWNLPQGEYLGADAQDVTLDFMLSNATLSPGGLQVAYYVDGRRFLIQDNCYVRHIKNLSPGLHRIRIELQDAHGDLIPGAFNSGERIIAISPHSSVPTVAPAADAYLKAPKLDSIPGAMTMGGPRAPQTVPLTDAQRAKQAALTVNRNGQTVRLDGQAVTRREGSVSLDDDSSDPAESPAGEFSVRAGGTPDADAEMTPRDESANVRRGSVAVRKSADLDDHADDDDGAAQPLDELDAAETAEEETGTTMPTVRRRADGTVGRVANTTAPMQLSDRPNLRQATASTTRTVHAQPRTTATGTRTSTGTQTANRAQATTGTRTTTGSQAAAPRRNRDERTTGTATSRREGRTTGSANRRSDRDGNRDAERRAGRTTGSARNNP